jgi:hypothetical protein
LEIVKFTQPAEPISLAMLWLSNVYF